MSMVDQKEIVLITGASGRIGLRLAEKLSKMYRVVGFDLFLEQQMSGLELIGVDMASEESINQGLCTFKEKYGSQIASIIHLASFYSFEGASWHQYQRITIDGTEHLFRSLRKHHFDVGQFVYASTMLVHEPSIPGKKIHENSPIAPKWNYPKSKVLAEDLIHRMQGDIPSVTLRIAGVYDERCCCIPLAHQIQRIYEKRLKSYLFPGDYTHGTAFLHINDLIEAIQKVVDRRKEMPHEMTLLLGEDKTYSYECFQREIGKYAFGKAWKTLKIPKWIAKLGSFFLQYIPGLKDSFIKPWMIDVADDHYELDITRAKKTLDWEPKNAAIDLIPIWIEQLKKEPLAWYYENELHSRRKVIEGGAHK